MRMKVILEAGPQGKYVAYVPALPGCIADGKTQEEALRNIHLSISHYMESIERDSFLMDGALVKEIEL